jgi:hypothetical protein
MFSARSIVIGNVDRSSMKLNKASFCIRERFNPTFKTLETSVTYKEGTMTWPFDKASNTFVAYSDASSSRAHENVTEASRTNIYVRPSSNMDLISVCENAPFCFLKLLIRSMAWCTLTDFLVFSEVSNSPRSVTSKNKSTSKSK